MPTDASDSVRLDDIWKSLKEECSISTKKRGPLKDINHLWETTKGGSSSTSASTASSTSTSTAANRKLLVRNRSRKHIYTHDDNNKSENRDEITTILHSSSIQKKTFEKLDNSTLPCTSFLFDGEVKNEETRAISKKQIAYDSDDDSDFDIDETKAVIDIDIDVDIDIDMDADDKRNASSKDLSSYSRMKLERLANLLQSEDRKVRLEVLVHLEREIQVSIKTLTCSHSHSHSHTHTHTHALLFQNSRLNHRMPLRT